jgi:hypothetical protein
LKPLEVVIEGEPLAVVVPDLGEPVDNGFNGVLKPLEVTIEDDGNFSSFDDDVRQVSRPVDDHRNPLLVPKDKLLAKFLGE